MKIDLSGYLPKDLIDRLKKAESWTLTKSQSSPISFCMENTQETSSGKIDTECIIYVKNVQKGEVFIKRCYVDPRDMYLNIKLGKAVVSPCIKFFNDSISATPAAQKKYHNVKIIIRLK